jgi:hypothetical protein
LESNFVETKLEGSCRAETPEIRFQGFWYGFGFARFSAQPADRRHHRASEGEAGTVKSMNSMMKNFSKKILSWSMIGTVAMVAVFALTLTVTPTANAGVFVRVGIAPPLLPIYAQPICPGDGYIWQPGYWGYGDDGYYWIDGSWVMAPYEGALWTPGYWGWGGGFYSWYGGYWGRRVGYYGGINYGFGYFGVGYRGGYWNGGHFFYDRGYNNIGGGIHNAYGARGSYGARGAEGFARNGGGSRSVASNGGARGGYSGNAGAHYSGGGGGGFHGGGGGGGFHGGGGGGGHR